MLPYVLFVIALAFVVITTSVHLYQDELRITHNQTEQLKIETLLQMARTQFKEDVFNTHESDGTISYEFPYGDVQIKYAKLNEKTYRLHFSIQTDTGAAHSIMNRLSIGTE